jgi:predicted nucleic acid-binding protein
VDKRKVSGVLIDTSVWVSHFRVRNEALVDLIENDRALTHPMVLAELSCGSLTLPRIQTLSKVEFLQKANQATLSEVRNFIEFERLHGLGCGIVDLMLLASTVISPYVDLWTLDKRLETLCKRFGVMHRVSLH